MIVRRSRIFTWPLVKDILTYMFSRPQKKKDYISLFENNCARYLGVKYAALTSSGRNGLKLILEYFDLPQGSEIILPAYTLKEIPLMIKEMGYVPRFVDIDPQTYNINPSLIEEKINEKTALILATHMFGLPCRIDKIAEIARKRNLKIIEDCAHSLGAIYKDKMAGTFGEASFFSLEIAKPINTFGGGIIATDNQNIYDFVKKKTSQYTLSRKKIIFRVIFPFLEELITRSPLYSLFGFLFYFQATKKIFFNIAYKGLRRSLKSAPMRYSNFQAFLGCRALPLFGKKNALLSEKLKRFRGLLDRGILYPMADYPHSQTVYFNLVRTKYNCGEIRKLLLCRSIDSGIKDEISDNCPLYFAETGDYPILSDVYNTLVQLPLSYEFDDRLLQFIAVRLNKAVTYRTVF